MEYNNQGGYYDVQGVYHNPQPQANPQMVNQYQNGYVQQANQNGYAQQQINYQNNYPQYAQQYQQPVSPAPQKKKKFANSGWLKIVIYVVVAIVAAVIISTVDGNTTDKLIGTWEYSQQIEYDDGYSFGVTENMVLTEGEYYQEINEEKTKASMMDMYDEIIVDEGITEEDVLLSGYASMQAFKEAMFEADYQGLLEIYEENKGTWRIEKGEFIFKEAGTTEEFRTVYEIDGDTLRLITDGITLTRVK